MAGWNEEAEGPSIAEKISSVVVAGANRICATLGWDLQHVTRPLRNVIQEIQYQEYKRKHIQSAISTSEIIKKITDF